MSADLKAAVDLSSPSRTREASARELSASRLGDRLASLSANIAKVIYGKDEAIDLAVVTLLSAGHLLIEDLPGVGKTVLAQAIARSISGSFKRIQFTPDLLPSDVTGTTVYDQASGHFRFQAGPVFAHVLLADEINRGTPRTQSSLLESMSEGQVTVDGVSRSLPIPHLVLATQNPIEYQGTYPLPIAQLDRFFARLQLGYPDADREIAILEAQIDHHPLSDLKAWGPVEDLLELQRCVHQVHVERCIADYIVRLVGATRSSDAFAVPASPRASLALFRGAQARALLRRRPFVVPDDVRALLVPLVAHRVMLRTDLRRDGRTEADLLEEVSDLVAAPV